MSFEGRAHWWWPLLLVAVGGAAGVASGEMLAPDPAIECDSCASWNEPVPPFRIHGQTYYVGVKGLSALLVATSEGLVLLDGALPQSAAPIAASITALGFDPTTISAIATSHAHYDHVGGVAALQRMSGARVLASAANLEVLAGGLPPADDPQAAFGPDETRFPPVEQVEAVADRGQVRIGDLVLTAHATPGHTPGGMSWSWQSCEAGECIDIVYADSLNAVSAPGFEFTTVPSRVEAFRASIERIAGLDCDVLVAVHPEFSELFERRDRIGEGSDASSKRFVDSSACRRYAEAAAARLERRLAEERSVAGKGSR